ncbi:MAG: chemotaxis response regulator protein-glutamate methylesterase [Pseudomonadota bacterium]
MPPPYKVLIVDDSAVVRQALSEIISSDPELTVMATAGDPFIAAERLRRERPDVITLDVEMPRMDGVTFLQKLMSQHPIPVVMCSTLVGANTETLADAMAAGAAEIICKPKHDVRGFIEESRIRICDAVKAAARAKVSLLRSTARTSARTKSSPDAMAPPPATRRRILKTTQKVIAVGASTGGTEALRVFLQAMPAAAPPIIIVQHMPEQFTAAFAERLNNLTSLAVKEARDGDRLLTGHAFVAPGNRHMLLTRSGAVYGLQLRDGPLVSRHRPSVDVLFRSVAKAAGQNAIGVIMTGMGSDGARGMLEMREAGAVTFGQDEATSVVYGMPKEAKKAGAVCSELPLARLPEAVLNACDERSPVGP